MAVPTSKLAPPSGAADSGAPDDGAGASPSADLSRSLSAGAERLLIGASVYREPADLNALLFQVGEPDRTAARAAGQPAPEPPYRAPPGLAGLVAACIAAGTLTIPADSAWANGRDVPKVLVDRQLASELHGVLASGNRQDEVATAHRNAARYWQWHAGGWPQSSADIHDLLEARYHLLEAGEIASACELTETVCAQLHAWGDIDREAELISDMLGRLHQGSAGRAALVHRLGQVAQVRRDYAAAERHYQQALHIFAGNGDRLGVSRCHHALGVLAQARGARAEAEQHYQQAIDADTEDVLVIR
jgi:tetratricopeptide (TPR) repeat protein